MPNLKSFTKIPWVDLEDLHLQSMKIDKQTDKKRNSYITTRQNDWHDHPQSFFDWYKHKMSQSKHHLSMKKYILSTTIVKILHQSFFVNLNKNVYADIIWLCQHFLGWVSQENIDVNPFWVESDKKCVHLKNT